MSQRRISVKSIVHLTLLFILLPGCGGGDGFKGDRGTVTGTITVGGSPVPEGCQVTFFGESASYTATGLVKENGQYSLLFKGSQKLPAIKYRVQISPPAKESPSATAVDPTSIPTLPNAKPAKPAAEAGPFPSKYSAATTSNLVFEVEAGANTADFDLEPIKTK